MNSFILVYVYCKVSALVVTYVARHPSIRCSLAAPAIFTSALILFMCVKLLD